MDSIREIDWVDRQTRKKERKRERNKQRNKEERKNCHNLLDDPFLSASWKHSLGFLQRRLDILLHFVTSADITEPVIEKKGLKSFVGKEREGFAKDKKRLQP